MARVSPIPTGEPAGTAGRALSDLRIVARPVRGWVALPGTPTAGVGAPVTAAGPAAGAGGCGTDRRRSHRHYG